MLYDSVRTFERKEKWKSTMEEQNLILITIYQVAKKKGDGYGRESSFNQINLLICLKTINLGAQKLKREKMKLKRHKIKINPMQEKMN